MKHLDEGMNEEAIVAFYRKMLQTPNDRCIFKSGKSESLAKNEGIPEYARGTEESRLGRVLNPSRVNESLLPKIHEDSPSL